MGIPLVGHLLMYTVLTFVRYYFGFILYCFLVSHMSFQGAIVNAYYILPGYCRLLVTDAKLLPGYCRLLVTDAKLFLKTYCFKGPVLEIHVGSNNKQQF